MRGSRKGNSKPQLGDPPTALVVDGDAEAVDSVKTSLRRGGYEVVSARTGGKALEKFGGEEIDIVVTELRLPDMDGVELLRELKRESPPTPAIVTTAFPSVDSAVEVMKEGADDYIQKPAEPRDIGTTVLGAVKDLESARVWREAIDLERNPLEIFKRLLREGRRGLYISTTSPRRLGEFRDWERDVEFVPLSDEEGDSKIHPEELNTLSRKITEVASEFKSAVALIDGVDRLLERNSPNDLKKFVRSIGSDLLSGRLALILTGDLGRIEENHLAELERASSDLFAGAVFESLSNYTRRKAISLLQDRETASFSTLSEKTGTESTPKLSFHLKELESRGLIEKDEEGRYRLTGAGKIAAETLLEMRDLGGPGRVIWMPKSSDCLLIDRGNDRCSQTLSRNGNPTFKP